MTHDITTVEQWWDKWTAHVASITNPMAKTWPIWSAQARALVCALQPFAEKNPDVVDQLARQIDQADPALSTWMWGRPKDQEHMGARASAWDALTVLAPIMHARIRSTIDGGGWERWLFSCAQNPTLWSNTVVALMNEPTTTKEELADLLKIPPAFGPKGGADAPWRMAVRDAWEAIAERRTESPRDHRHTMMMMRLLDPIMANPAMPSLVVHAIRQGHDSWVQDYVASHIHEFGSEVWVSWIKAARERGNIPMVHSIVASTDYIRGDKGARVLLSEAVRANDMETVRRLCSQHKVKPSWKILETAVNQNMPLPELKELMAQVDINACPNVFGLAYTQDHVMNMGYLPMLIQASKPAVLMKVISSLANKNIRPHLMRVEHRNAFVAQLFDALPDLSRDRLLTTSPGCTIFPSCQVFADRRALEKSCAPVQKAKRGLRM